MTSDSVWFGNNFLQIGDFRIADIDGTHASIVYVSSGLTAEIFRSDSTQHSGPRRDFNANTRTKYPLTASLSGGDGFIQIGNWRFGRVDDNHFSFSSNNGRTAVILRSDGTVHGGDGLRTDWGLSHMPITWTYSASNPIALESLPNVRFGTSWVQFGPNIRIGTTDNWHLSVSFQTPCCGKSGIHTAGNAS